MKKPIVISEELQKFIKKSKWNLNSNYNQYGRGLTYFYINIEEDSLPYTCSAKDISVCISPENKISKPFLKELTFLTLLNFFKRKEKDLHCRCIYMHLTKNQIETNFTKEMFDDLGIKFLFSYMGNHDDTIYVFHKLVDDQSKKDYNFLEDDYEEDEEWYPLP
jgi:hypothetical protein